MIKSSIIALVAVAAMGSVAAPAFADTLSSGTGNGISANHDDAFGDGTFETRSAVADSVLARLQEQGVKATSVEAWGGLVRAYIVQPDGSQAMQYFTPDTLSPVKL